MSNDFSRRAFLKTAGPAGLMTGVPGAALAFQGAPRIVQDVVLPASPPTRPKYSIKFAVIGLDHNHINGITDALRRGGGELVAVHSANPQGLADFQKRYADVKVAANEEEILSDPSIQLVASAAIPYLRAPLGVRAMRHGKDYLSDKPAIITLEQLAEVRKAVKETGRIFGIMYSERLENRASVKAGELVKGGAIGRIVQTMNIAPHQVNEKTRPDWFWILRATAASSATSAPTRPISLCITPIRPPPM